MESAIICAIGRNLWNLSSSVEYVWVWHSAAFVYVHRLTYVICKCPNNMCEHSPAFVLPSLPVGATDETLSMAIRVFFIVYA